MNWVMFSYWQTLVSALLLLLCQYLAAEDKTKCTFTNHRTAPKTLPLLDSLVGYRFSVTDADNKYEYSLGICTMAIQEIGEDDAGVIQVDITDPNKKKTVIVGKFSNAEIRGGIDWVMLEYRGGDPYANHCDHENRTAVIMITCDPIITNIEDVKVQILDEVREKHSECCYLFEIGHHSVCKDISLVTFRLSIGSILVIVFISVCALYVLLGFLYNRFVLGAKGMEQIPNYNFWKDFGNLQADGCNFICRTGRSQEPRSYKGIGDDQLQEDDERDDHLLPM